MKYLYISSTYRWKDNENNSIYPCTNNSVGGSESEAKVSATEEETERRNPKKINIYFEEGNCIEITLFSTTVKFP